MVVSKQRHEDKDQRKRRQTGSGAAPSTSQPHKWNVELWVCPDAKFRLHMMTVPSWQWKCLHQLAVMFPQDKSESEYFY